MTLPRPYVLREPSGKWSWNCWWTSSYGNRILVSGKGYSSSEAYKKWRRHYLWLANGGSKS